MQIPPRIARVLSKDQALHGSVNATLAAFEPWIADNKLPFFPGYTDHGVTHVERVMRSAEWLVRDEAWSQLTARDGAVLVLSVLLHDCAMHLREGGFQTLIRGGYHASERPFFRGQLPGGEWPTLWAEFLREARRFDDRKLLALFGEVCPVRPPPENALHWEEADRLLIGEFIRRHHARLAHEIALFGVPGPEGEKPIAFSADLDVELRDFAGFVARSHGLDLRKAVDLMPRKRRGLHREVHAPFLMGLLRIADYLEIDAARAPRTLHRVRSLESPYSRQEWDNHAAVRGVDLDQDDAEALYVDVDATRVANLTTFLGLKNLLAGIQRELDATWVVLGEVYRGEATFGPRIRRLRSSLEDIVEREAPFAFVPMDVSFEAGGEVLKTLVGPLYGDDARYGVRELLQNAVDACRERADWPGPLEERADLEADVVITVREESKGTGWISVVDRGIGMTPEVIRDYFLRAGASFRNSENWHRLHDDADGTPRVVRSGRFGVGALAAFLLGDELEVTTRHASEERQDRGVRFKCRLDSPSIEMRWCTCPVGTSIRIPITKEPVWEALSLFHTWDWYRLAKPSVARVVALLRPVRVRRTDERMSTIGETKLTIQQPLPHGVQPPPFPWRVLNDACFDVLWSFHDEGGQDTGWSAFCNGIELRSPNPVLVGADLLWWRSESADDLGVKRPNLAILDRLGQLPLDLLRTEISGEPSFAGMLTSAVCRDILAFLLLRCGPDRLQTFIQLASQALRHPGVLTNHEDGYPKIDFTYPWLFLHDHGLTLDEPELHPEGTVVGRCDVLVHEEDEIMRHRKLVSPQWPTPEALSRALERVASGFLVGVQSAMKWKDFQTRFKSDGCRSAAVLFATNRSLLGEPQDALGLRVEDLNAGWTLAWCGDDPRPSLQLEQATREPPDDDDLPLVFWLYEPERKPQAPANPLATAWSGVLGSPTIPYAPDERRRVLAHAFSQLAEDIAFWAQVSLLRRTNG